MAFAADYEVLFDRLDEELWIAPQPASDGLVCCDNFA
jgi:hypothetical protein